MLSHNSGVIKENTQKREKKQMQTEKKNEPNENKKGKGTKEKERRKIYQGGREGGTGRRRETEKSTFYSIFDEMFLFVFFCSLF